MPRRGSPYGPRYVRARAALLAARPVCHVPGCDRLATEADHVPPLSLHTHVEGSGCCQLLPACGPCQRRQARELQNAALGRRSSYRREQPPPSRSW